MGLQQFSALNPHAEIQTCTDLLHIVADLHFVIHPQNTRSRQVGDTAGGVDQTVTNSSP